MVVRNSDKNYGPMNSHNQNQSIRNKNDYRFSRNGNSSMLMSSSRQNQQNDNHPNNMSNSMNNNINNSRSDWFNNNEFYNDDNVLSRHGNDQNMSFNHEQNTMHSPIIKK